MKSTKDIDQISYQIIGAAIEVHKLLGPGLLESVYHRCMAKELEERGIYFISELLVPIEYKGLAFETVLKCDFYVEDCVAVEIKSIDVLAPVHEAQLLTYMRLLSAPKGVLINFNCTNIFHHGQKTFVNDLYRKLHTDPETATKAM